MEPDALTTPHLDDGALLLLLEEEGAAEDAHLRACADCAGRLERYRLRSERLGTLLARADFPLPATALPERGVIPLRRAHRGPLGGGWLRAAAVVLILVAATALATPARAWIAQWVGTRWAALTHRQPSLPGIAPASVPAGPAQPASAAAVRFVPSGPELRVDLAHSQQAGTLTLVPVPGEAAGAEVLGGPPVNLLVVPSGVRIGNAPGGAGSYRITIPAGVRRIRVRVGAREAALLTRGELGEQRSIPLRAPGTEGGGR